MAEPNRREPDLAGPDPAAPQTRIWLVHADVKKAGIATWCAWAPWCHPLWSWHGIDLIHLRDIDGVPPAKIRHPGATHELLVWSIDPSRCPDPDPDTPPWPYLTPFDLDHQFIAADDADALARVETCLQRVIAGTLSLDQDYRRVWRHLLGGEQPDPRDGVTKTIVSGRHG